MDAGCVFKNSEDFKHRTGFTQTVVELLEYPP